VSQSSEFCRHNPSCFFSTSVYYCYFVIDSVRKLLDTSSSHMNRECLSEESDSLRASWSGFGSQRAQGYFSPFATTSRLAPGFTQSSFQWIQEESFSSHLFTKPPPSDPKYLDSNLHFSLKIETSRLFGTMVSYSNSTLRHNREDLDFI
jgi:hypothetical protein